MYLAFASPFLSASLFVSCRKNEIAKTECILDLRRLLHDLGTLPFSSEEITLKRSLGQLYQEVTSFCKTHNIDETPKKEEEEPVMPPPPPPPPPPPAPPITQPNVKPTKRRSTEGNSLESGCETPAAKKGCPATSCVPQQTPYRHGTPLQNFNTSLISTISGGLLKRQLRRTPCVRSPGGTPARLPRQLRASDPADMLALALQVGARRGACVYQYLLIRDFRKVLRDVILIKNWCNSCSEGTILIINLAIDQFRVLWLSRARHRKV